MTGARVSIFLPSLSGGGAERSMVVVANGLAARGHDVSLVLASAVGPYAGIVGRGVRTVDLGCQSAPQALIKLARHLRKAQPQVLLAAMSHANVVAALAHRLARSRARLVLSERVNLSSLFTEYRDWRTRAMRQLMRLTYPWADQIVAVSHGVADDLERNIQLPAGRLTTIYNPVVDDHLRDQAAVVPEHPWMNADQPPVVLSVGRLTAQKDYETLMRAFAKVRACRPVRLLVLGEGELRASLLEVADRLGVGSDVAFPGFAENPFAFMRAARVFVLSSRFEGLPGVLIQAMACGARVVSTDCPSGPREVLEGGRWGRLVPVGDPAAMASAIEAALDDHDPPDVRIRSAAFTAEHAIAAYARVLGVK